MAKKKKNKKPGPSVLANNKKAYHEYIISDKYEAGVSLLGTEVKSLRAGKANLKESYCRIRGNEVFLVDCHISPWSHANVFNHEPLRPRRLLLHRREINKLIGATAEKGFTIVPLKFYIKGPRIKLEIGLAKGKHLYDKRETKKRKDIERDTARQMRDYN